MKATRGWTLDQIADSIRGILCQRVDVDRKNVGIVVGVVNEQGRRAIGYGKVNRDPVQAPDGTTVFEIGSITKPFTALLLADMVLRGALALDEPIAGFLPASVHVPTWNGKEITLLHLATHTSGLPRLPGNFSPANAANPYADYTVEQMYAFLSQYSLSRDVGEAYEYSNLGYGLLGHILTLHAGMDYESLVRTRICEPLGLQSTCTQRSPDLGTRLASGHDADGHPVPNWDNPTLPGAGALLSTANDMLAFLAAHLGLVTSPLSAAMEMTHLPRRRALGANLDIGLGWLVQREHGIAIVWHNGGTGGYRCFAGIDKQQRTGVVVLSNSSSDVDDIGLHLLDPGYSLKQFRASRQHVAARLTDGVPPDLAGHYEFSQSAFDVTVQDGRAYLLLPGQGPLEILPESDSQFFLQVAEDVEYTFVRDEGGLVTHVIAYQDGLAHEGKKRP